MRGQLSAEMVILLVIVIAVIALVASSLFSGAKQASSAFESKVGNVSESIKESCFTDFDCGSGQVCSDGKCVADTG